MSGDGRETSPLSTAAVTVSEGGARPLRILPPVLGRLLRGTFWMALRTPLQALFALWTVPLIVETVGEPAYGAYGFAWGFGFLQFLLEFGMSSALNRQVAEAWTRDDRPAVDRAIACGLNFYAAVSVIQVLALLSIAIWGIPDRFGPGSHELIVKLLVLQAVTAPCYGLGAVIGSVLQAARRYDILPRFELAIVVLRFAVLFVGLKAGCDFFAVVAAQIAVQVGLSLGPGLWVMARELGYVPRFARVSPADFAGLLHVSLYMFLIQLSVVLADKLDTTVLGYALDDPESGVSIYQAISKPFLQLRQTGWMLAYLVMPAVASLVAAGDSAALEKIKYDGTRFLVALLLPIGLLAALYARPFLALWIPRYADQAGLMRLFLVAALPLVLSVVVQVAIGMNKVRVIALSALAGSIVNLPLSYALTLRMGVSGVIWGTVLTTLISNGLIPGWYVFRELGIGPGAFLKRTLAAPLAGAAALVVACLAMGLLVAADPVGAGKLARIGPFLAHLSVGCLAYLAGYAAVPGGRADLAELLVKLRNRAARGGASAA
ncbi:MAG: oligosaccharide flippase family protein [Isosphaeraceae bacterium]